MLEFIKLNIPGLVLVKFDQHGLHQSRGNSTSQMFQHQIQFIASHCIVLVSVELLENFSYQKVVLCSLALLDKLKP